MRLAPGYVLANQDGLRISHEDLRGHIVIYNIAFTNCEGECAQGWVLMANLQDELARLQSEIPLDLVTISVDSERDTVEALQQFALQQGIDSKRWHLLTGEAEQMKYVVGDGFNTYYTTTTEGVLDLEPSLAIVDGVGILRAQYRTNLPTLAEVLRDVDLLLTEARNSKGLTRYAYEAAHLFLCYP
jgi:protein SCO1/2